MKNKEQVLKKLHELNEKRDKAKAIYFNIKSEISSAIRHDAPKCHIEPLVNLSNLAHDLWMNAEDEITRFVMSDW